MSYQNRSLREIIFENNAALNTTIAAETSRAQTAEQANAAAILAEEQRVDAILLNAPPLLDTFKEVVDAYEAADQSLTLITNNNTNNITANSNALSAEITRATGAESANTTSITNEVARATGAESANATDIATETTRATTAETANTAAINAEIARATAAEGANTTNLNTEITRAQTAEGLNTTNLNAEITRAVAAEGLNTSNLNAEITRATNAEVANATAIATKQNTITASTPLTTGVLTATEISNDIDIRNNITAGSNITLTQTGNITSIASTGGVAGVNLPNPVIGVKQWYGATSAGGTNVIKLVNGTIPANTTLQVFEISAYTLKESSANGSKWNCDFDCDYEYAGNANDTVKSKIYWKINSGSWQTQGHRQQKFDAGVGGGTRSGVIFPAHISKPLTLSYNAGDTIKFRVDVQTSGDDTLYIRTGTNETKVTANFQEILEDNINNVNSSTNLTVASITAIGSTNDIDLRNNIIAGTGINLTQISNTTGIAVDPAPLAAEVTRATAAEGVNATNIAAEITRATAAEGVNATNITAEITRATAAEGVNATAIATNVTDIATNATNIAAEITRATAAEGANATNIAAEITRATAAEGANATNIAAEITRATAAEGVNATAIATNVTDIATNTTNIAAEITRATAAEGANATNIATNTTDIATNATNIAAEITRATAAEGANATNIATNTTNIATNTTDIATNTTNIATNTTDIATNATAITTKQDTITGSTALTTGALTAIQTSNDIDLRNNISAGSNITLTQTGNVTSIASSGGGAATSQQYYFRATSNNNNNQTINQNTVLLYNVITYDIPANNYITSNNNYVVPVAGTWQFFFQAYQNSSATLGFRLGIYKNGTLEVQTGGSVGNSERCGVILECAVGDTIDVRGATGTAYVYMKVEFSWFEGYLLQPVNNTVTSSTALTTGALTAIQTSNNIDLRNNISAGSNITLTQTGNVTEIASSGGSTRSIFSAGRNTNLFVPITTTDVRFPYAGTPIITDSNYSWVVSTPIGGAPDEGTLTFNTAGTYLVSATVNLFASSYDNRVVGRIRPLTNGSWSVGDGQAFCYLRHDDYGDYESCTLSQYPMVFAVNDTLQIQIVLTKSNFTPWVSNFNGVAMAAGNNLTIEKIA